MPFKTLTPQPPEVNKFTLTVGTSGNTTYILDRSYAAGVYTVTFQGGDNTFDIYAIGVDGTNVGYTNSGTLTATGKIKEVVVLGAANNEEIIFDNVQAGDVITPTSKGDVASAGAFVTSIDISSLPNIDDSTTVTGGNFAADVEAYFIDQSANEVAAKTVVRNSSTEIVVTRPDSFSTAGSPFTIKVVNPNVTLPTGSSAHLLSNSVTAGTNPVWQTTAAQAYSIGIANTITLVASDTEASDVDYAITAGSLPAGLTLDGETGVISGTPSGGADGDQTVFTVRATDAGGNFVDREFTFTANAAPTWTTTSSDIGEAGVLALNEAASFQFVADGGTGGGSLTYSVQSGNLPTGTSLSSTGLLTGTPNTEETATFTLRVTDEAGLFADREFTVQVASTNAYTLIAEVDLTGGDSSGDVQINNIPQDYKHIEMFFSYRLTTTSNTSLYLYPNKVATNVRYIRMTGLETNAYISNTQTSSGSGIFISDTGGSSHASYTTAHMQCIDYTNPNTYPAFTIKGGHVSEAEMRVGTVAGASGATGALTSLGFRGSALQESKISIYGVK